MKTTSTKIKGHAGELFVASKLGIALFAESSSTSLYEDALKNDIRFVFMNKLEKGLIILNCQVKFGNSFLSSKSSENVTITNIDDDTITTLGNSFSILCIIPDEENPHIFWTWIDNRTKIKRPIKINKTHYIDPSIGYELSRNYIYHKYQKQYPMLTLSEKLPSFNDAKNIYKKLQGRSPVKNPLFGEIQITRLAWRHKTRKSKTKNERVNSLNIIGFLEEILKRTPDRYYIQHSKINNEGPITRRTNYIVCWYNKSIKISGIRRSFLIRLKEDITYPSNWEKSPLVPEDISYKCTLQSWWPKK